MIGLNADPQDSGLTHRVATATHHPELAGGDDQVLVAHQFGHRGRDLGSDPAPYGRKVVASRLIVEDPLPKPTDRQVADTSKSGVI